MPISSTPIGRRSSVTVAVPCGCAAVPPVGDSANAAVAAVNPATPTVPARARRSRRLMLVAGTLESVIMAFAPGSVLVHSVGTRAYLEPQCTVLTGTSARGIRGERMRKAVASETSIRERILAAAFKAFMEKGYAATSTLEIATRAKVSKRDLYATFGTKQAMLVGCIASRATRMRLAPQLPTP